MKIATLLTVLLSVRAMWAATPIDTLAKYDVIWDSPSADACGSMPIGNGDIGLNVWVEPSGDLCFFIGKTDAWDENLRLLKLTKIRVKLDPPLDTTNGFQQELKLADGAIVIRDTRHEVRVWVDANHPVIQVDAKSLAGRPIDATVQMEPWRKEKRPIQGGEYHSTGFTSLPAFSYPDTILPHTSKQIGWFHRNLVSPWLASLKLQKLEAIAQTEQDPILNRTIGGIIRGDNLVSVSDSEMKTAEPAGEVSLCIHVLTQITDTLEQWIAAMEKQAAAIESEPEAGRWQEHCRWWNAFWNRSWIFAEGGGVAFPMPANNQPWRVGVDSNGSSRFGGEIAQPRVIGRALTAEEVAQLARQKAGEGTEFRAEEMNGGCTVAAWIKPAGREQGRILDKCTSGRPDGFTFDTYPGLSLRWLVGNSAMILPNCLTAGEWQHVAATVDANTGARRIYLNGKLVKEDGGSSAEIVTRGYTLQRWINACGGRGAFPIKFNGSIFVVDNKYDADFRQWGGGYWFQNTRLPYWSMLTAGDFDLMQPLFRMFMDALPARELATKIYYGHDGAFYPETQSFWGNYLDQGDLGYGTNRAGKPDGQTDNQFIFRYWQGGLELVAMMLDYYDLTQDGKFRDGTLIPFATQIITFFDQHWKRGADGKILFYPSQSLETWWDCTNPTPEIAGLRYVLPRLQEITGDHRWQKTLDDLPPVPLSADAPRRILPAEKYASRHNIENTELYAVFPYRLYVVGKPDLDIGRNTFAARAYHDNGGWQQNSIQAALLGQTDEASRCVLDSASRHADGFRFPAMWGPNYDWTPDQDHGSVMMNALQRMLLQYEGDKIYLLPAWPKNWNVAFKLHAPQNTTIEGVYRGGKLEELRVDPAVRRKDVILEP